MEENGEFVKIIAPKLYETTHSEYEAAIYESCVQVSQKIKMIQCYYDKSDGEVYFQIDIPLEDNNLSEKQLMRAIGCIVETVDTFDSGFRSAVDTGEATIIKILDEQKKKVKLVQLIKDSPDVDLDKIIQQLEFTNSSSTVEQIHLVKH